MRPELNWDDVGWKVRVRFLRLQNQVRPKDHINLLRPLLPDRYAPLQTNGNGSQSIYLTELSSELFGAVAMLIGAEANHIRDLTINQPLHDRQVVSANMEMWEHHLEDEIESDTWLPSAECEAVIMAHRGQGLFRQRVAQLERMGRITKVDNLAHLRASHAKPWRDSINNDERLYGENGLLLTPSIDHLFDRGFLTFENSGRLVVSPIADVNVNGTDGTAGQRATECRTFQRRAETFSRLSLQFGVLAIGEGLSPGKLRGLVVAPGDPEREHFHRYLVFGDHLLIAPSDGSWASSPKVQKDTVQSSQQTASWNSYWPAKRTLAVSESVPQTPL